MSLIALMAGSGVALAGQAADGRGAAPATREGPPPPAAQQAFKLPGTDLSLTIGGYIKLDFIQDFDPMGEASDFKVSSIPIDGSAAAAASGRTTIHARETRLNLDLRSDGTGWNHFRAFVEGDFYGDSNAFRLRHAFGEFGPVLAGQTWSTFQDISARPLTIDFEGPDGEVFLRQPMVRYTWKHGSGVSIAIAAEQPTPQFAVPADVTGSPRSTVPDIPGYFRYTRGAGHVQVAGLVRQIRFDSTGSLPDTAMTGYGVNLTFVLPMRASAKLLGQFAVGEGIARYIEGLSGQNVDAMLTSTGDLRGIRTQAGNIGYILQLRPDLKTGVAVSTTFVAGDDLLPAVAVERLMDVRASLLWTARRHVDIGGEVLWGERRNQDGGSGDAVRLQFAFIYRLN